MRQAIFVMVLVAAAFLGGAMVNGPGIRWVQSRLLDYMGLKDGGEIASIDLPPAPTSTTASQTLPGDPPLPKPSRPSTGAGIESAAKLSKGQALENQSRLKEYAQFRPTAGTTSGKQVEGDTQGSVPSFSPATTVPEPAAPRPGDPADQPTPVGRPGPALD